MATHARTTYSTLYVAFLLGGLGVLVLHTTVGLGGPGADGLIDDGVYNVLMFGAALAVIARGILIKPQRAAWFAMGAGLLSWSLGELYFTLFVSGSGAASGSVTPADGFYLAMYPCMYVALTLLVGSHLRELRISMWLDGLIGGLAAAAVAAAVVLPPILDNARGEAAPMAITLAYPIGDLLLLIFAIGALGMTGWRPGRVWMLIAASMLMTAIADSTYLYLTATDAYREGTWLEGLWPGAAILLALAAWTPWPRATRRRVEDWRLVSVPAVSLLSALGVFVYGNVHHQLTLPALILATATVLAVSARLMFTVRENLAMLVASRRLALTDPLTGLGNRRRLMEDLQLACRPGAESERWKLVLYDLNGFKRYNDTFGHPAGDALLTRLSDRLHAAVATHGAAYRMGGDEFCVLFRDAAAGQEDEQERGLLVAASVGALSEHGPGFSIGAAHGEVSIPAEGSEPAAILQLADQRLYERKDLTRDPADAIRLLRASVGGRLDAAAVEAAIAVLAEPRRPLNLVDGLAAELPAVPAELPAVPAELPAAPVFARGRLSRR
jgi:two-component system cell cycle response regulator